MPKSSSGTTQVREIIELLSTILVENGTSLVQAEHFRLAKFDKPDVVSNMNLACAIVIFITLKRSYHLAFLYSDIVSKFVFIIETYDSSAAYFSSKLQTTVLQIL